MTPCPPDAAVDLRLRRKPNPKHHGEEEKKEGDGSPRPTLDPSKPNKVTAATQSATNDKEGDLPEPVWSSGVPFYPPSRRYWRIGRKWYDLEPFLDKHPGGKQVLLLSRDRFEDATFVFEAHHHNYNRVRKILNKYEVPSDKAPVSANSARPSRQDRHQVNPKTHFDKHLDHDQLPQLLGDDAFYSVLRRRVNDYLISVGCPIGEPTWACLTLFWINFGLWFSCISATWWTGRIELAILTGIVGSWLGGFGHNWVHQPKYKDLGFALLSLDTLGFSSEGWFREHLLQHHMYTNTPWDNHFKGTDPFLITDPTVERNWIQRNIMPFANPIVLSFGVYGNYCKHLFDLCSGLEVLSIGKLCLPLEFYFMMSRWGFVHGLALMFATQAVTGNYYFTMALMNHNAASVLDVKKRNASKDWGIAQLHSSADWGVSMSFLQAGIYLWLNYHTIHHLFPRVDFSHHPAIQQILIQTCKEYNVEYVAGSPGQIYKEMIHTFATPQSLFQEILVYSGGI